jgi:hypothetical protein
MQDEEMRVLKMVENGKVSPEDGARLLEAIRTKRAQGLPAVRGGGGRALRINVLGNDGERVNVSIPLVLARFAVSFLPQSAVQAMEKEGVTVEELKRLIADVEGSPPMEIVDIEADDARVRISIE